VMTLAQLKARREELIATIHASPSPSPPPS
jgi:hypothetical protein